MRFTSANLKYFKDTKRELKNGEVLLLNNIGKGIQEKQYNVISELNDNNWNFYILLNKKNDDTFSLCQLIPYQNNDSWPFAPIMIIS